MNTLVVRSPEKEKRGEKDSSLSTSTSTQSRRRADPVICVKAIRSRARGKKGKRASAQVNIGAKKKGEHQYYQKGRPTNLSEKNEGKEGQRRRDTTKKKRGK